VGAEATTDGLGGGDAFGAEGLGAEMLGVDARGTDARGAQELAIFGMEDVETAAGAEINFGGGGSAESGGGAEARGAEASGAGAESVEEVDADTS
jgi:hypothetical protein